MFAQSGWEVVGLCRHPEQVQQMPNVVTLDTADVSDMSSWSNYLEPGDILVYGVNPPYDKWHSVALPYLESALEVAEKKTFDGAFSR